MADIRAILADILEKAEIKDADLRGSTIDVLVNDVGVERETDLRILKEKDLLGAGIKAIPARRILKVITDSEQAELAAQQAETEAKLAEQRKLEANKSYLPEVPDDDSWLEVLKTVNALEVDDKTYISAVHAALAHKLGIYNVPERLVSLMEKFALNNDKILSKTFYEVSHDITRTNYGEIFAAMPSVDGDFVTKKRREDTLSRLDQFFWPALAESRNILEKWYRAWQEMNSTSVVLAEYMRNNGDRADRVPDTAAIREAATDLRRSISKAFAGTGPVVVTAMSYDYTQIRKVLAKAELPAEVGVVNHDQLYRKLGLKIGPGMINNERNLARYVVSMVHADAVPKKDELNYYQELYFLAEQIDWEGLLAKKPKPMKMTNAAGKKVPVAPKAAEEPKAAPPKAAPSKPATLIGEAMRSLDAMASGDSGEDDDDDYDDDYEDGYDDDDDDML